MADAPLAGWQPLPVDPREQADFDRGYACCKTNDPREKIAYTLTVMGRSKPGGSFEQSCRIMANEVMKMQLSPPAQPQPPAAPLTPQSPLDEQKLRDIALQAAWAYSRERDAPKYLPRSTIEAATWKPHTWVIAAMRDAIKASAAQPETAQTVAIRCPSRVANGGTCPHHNLQCGWPDCNKETS